MTSGRFIEEHYRATMVGLEPSTRVRDESYLRTHILATFGDRTLASIDYTDCQAWVNQLSTRRAPATVVKAAQIMGKVMKRRSGGVGDRTTRWRRCRCPRSRSRMTSVSGGPRLTHWPTPSARSARGTRSWCGWGCYGGANRRAAALGWTDLDVLRRTLTVSQKVIDVSAGMVEGP
ncbi:MAG: N-terminal phage integrase SAM-like domain-containing protein, partial [Chloroflexota bacterium]|nr:N-terminal phage integrase SAM-like domain-containing protein [Chloroflexota bacterium]